MSIFFSLFFLVHINNETIVINQLFPTLSNCQEMARILTEVSFPNEVIWECSPKKGNTA